MAYLEINVNGKTSTITSDETKAANILADVAALFELEGNAQAQLDQVAQLIKQKVVEWSRQYRTPAAVSAAQEIVATDTDYFWEE